MQTAPADPEVSFIHVFCSLWNLIMNHIFCLVVIALWFPLVKNFPLPFWLSFTDIFEEYMLVVLEKFPQCEFGHDWIWVKYFFF